MADHPSSPVSAPDIRDGIEWFTIRRPDGQIDEDCQCARCGSSCEWVQCRNCNGDGFVPVDSPEGWDEGDEEPCLECQSCGGRWHCISSPEFCQANPIPGREWVESTAMNAEAWRDCD